MSLPSRPARDLPADAPEGGPCPPCEDLRLPRPWQLALTAGWNFAESLGLPAAGYIAGAALGGQAVGMAVATGVVWLTVAVAAVTVGGTAAGAFGSLVWFIRVLRRCGLHVRFTQA
jgi:hypothetical protein